jgi:integrase
LVRRNYVPGSFTSPKSGKERRVDLTKELRRVLLDLRDTRMFEAFKAGEEEVSGLVFPSETGGPLDGGNLYHRDFLPCLRAARFRRVTFHAFRHTYASLLIQGGASLAYVKEQMGHISIQVTVDIYGHLIPAANIAWADALDSTISPQQSATQLQLTNHADEEKLPELVDNDWWAQQDSNLRPTDYESAALTS